MDVFAEIPSADVVPKSEVELYKRQVDELEDELASTYDKLENAKTDVAREIFEEIEAGLEYEKSCFYNALQRAKRIRDKKTNIMRLQIYAHVKIVLNAVKKKYTEDKE